MYILVVVSYSSLQNSGRIFASNLEVKLQDFVRILHPALGGLPNLNKAKPFPFNPLLSLLVLLYTRSRRLIIQS